MEPLFDKRSGGGNHLNRCILKLPSPKGLRFNLDNLVKCRMHFQCTQDGKQIGCITMCVGLLGSNSAMQAIDLSQLS